MRCNSKKVTIRFSKNMKLALHQAVVAADFGKRGKSKWLAKALKNYIDSPYLLNLTENGISEAQAELTEVEAFYLTPEAQENIKTAIKKIRAINPYFEGVQSAVIRSCIVFSLMF